MEPGRGADGPGGRGRPHSQVIQRKSRRVSKKAKCLTRALSAGNLTDWEVEVECFANICKDGRGAAEA